MRVPEQCVPDRRQARSSAAAALLVVLSLTVGCGAARRPCVSDACADGTVCDLDGTCRALPDPAQASTFSEADALYALGYTNPTRRARDRAASDRLTLGGAPAGVVNLVFAVPTYRRAIVEAVLVLFPYPNGRTATAPGTLSVHRVRAREVLDPRRRTPLLPIGRRLAARLEQPSAAQPVRLDVTRAVRATSGARLGLQVRMTRGGGDAPWLLASPDTLDEARRPRVELLLR
ncbi:MAG: hypothetical protein R3B40_23400 [Polyangiales bacterium]|nr:hypothetical protein [Myxococcales bacterium]MCB9661431.1 hypothetical protein [Sandaracinaceae bacterium]